MNQIWKGFWLLFFGILFLGTSIMQTEVAKTRAFFSLERFNGAVILGLAIVLITAGFRKSVKGAIGIVAKVEQPRHWQLTGMSRWVEIVFSKVFEPSGLKERQFGPGSYEELGRVAVPALNRLGTMAHVVVYRTAENELMAFRVNPDADPVPPPRKNTSVHIVN